MTLIPDAALQEDPRIEREDAARAALQEIEWGGVTIPLDEDAQPLHKGIVVGYDFWDVELSMARAEWPFRLWWWRAMSTFTEEPKEGDVLPDEACEALVAEHELEILEFIEGVLSDV